MYLLVNIINICSLSISYLIWLLSFFIAYFIVLLVLRCTHEYFSKILSTFTKCVLSTYSSTFKTVSTQYLLEYFFLVLASSLQTRKVRVTVLSHNMLPLM